MMYATTTAALRLLPRALERMEAGVREAASAQAVPMHQDLATRINRILYELDTGREVLVNGVDGQVDGFDLHVLQFLPHASELS
jgi:hypothetical protein